MENLNVYLASEKENNISAGIKIRAEEKTKSFSFLTFLLVLFALSLQIQSILTFNPSEIQLTISDLILPLMLIAFILQTFKQELHGFHRPHRFHRYHRFLIIFKIFRWPLWFTAFSIWYGFCVWNGCHEMGSCSAPDYLNKFSSWFVLVFYFYLGNLLRNGDDSNLNILLKFLFLSSSIISIFSIAYQTPFGIGSKENLTGFFENSQSYGLFSVFVVLIQLPFLINSKLFSRTIHLFLIIPNITVIVLSGFGIFMIALIAGVISYIIHNVLKPRQVLILIISGIMIFSFTGFQNLNKYFDIAISQFYPQEQSANERMKSTAQALNWWQEKPWTGIGLGSFVAKQQQQQQQQQNITSITMTLQNTPLWLLTETGLIGLLLYCGFLFRGRNEILSRTKEIHSATENNNNLLAQGMLIVFPAFIIASIAMESFYQSYIWFFLGLVLARYRAYQ